MKKFFLLLVMLSTLTASAYDAQIDGIYYNFTETEATVTSGSTKYTGSIEIPSTVTYNDKTYSVTSIGVRAFQSCSGLTSVTIPNSVLSIEHLAFASCPDLASVIIPNSVTSIGNMIFSSCSGLTSITIPNSVTSIGMYIFNDCYIDRDKFVNESSIDAEANGYWGLTLLDSREDGFYISNKVLVKYKGKETEVKIPNSVTSIKNEAFYKNTGLTSVTIPNSVTSIGNMAFSGCSKLVSIISEITKPFAFGKDAFSSISSSCVITVPCGTKDAYIAKGWTTSVFKGGVIEVTPEVDGIYYNFENNTKQATVVAGDIKYAGRITIPETVAYNGIIYGVTSISNNAFSGCSGLTLLTIANSVTSIGSNAFEGCTGDLVVNCNIPSISQYVNSAFYGSKFCSVKIGERVDTIGDYAFYGCKSIISMSIGNSVSLIGDYAFYGCSGLTGVTIPNSVKSIENRAFSGCTGLTSVTIPNSVTSIGTGAFNNTAWYNNQPDGLVYAGKVAYEYKGSVPVNTSITLEEGTFGIAGGAFRDCSGLTSITIPNSVTSIGSEAFYNCNRLTSVTSLITEPFTFGSSAFSNISSSCVLTVPYRTKEAYIAKGWTTNIFKSGVVETKPNVDGIYYSFDNNKQATVIAGNTKYAGKIKIPEAISYGGVSYPVTSIEITAFYGCDGLTEITIGNSVKTIGRSAFSGCSALKSVTIGNSVTSIGDNAFYNCTGLTSITIPNSVTSIGENCFYNCYSLTSIKIGESVTSIGSSAFSKCRRLDSLTIGNSVKSIGESAFNGCEGLTSVIIPNSVTAIGNYAFEGCFRLTSITIGSGVASIGSGAFSKCSVLTKVFCYAENAPYIASNTFSNSTYSNGTLYVSESSISNYKTTSSWRSFIRIKGDAPLDGVHYYLDKNTQKAEVTSYDDKIVNVTIPDEIVYDDVIYSVVSVGDYAFCNQTKMKTVTIPNSVTSIGKSAFSGCSSLTCVIIPNSVTTIGTEAFIYTNLRTLIVGSGVRSFGSNVFSTKPIKTIWFTNSPPQNYTFAQGTVNYVTNSQYSSLSNVIEYKFLSSMFEVDGIRYVPVNTSDRTCEIIDCINDETSTEIKVNPSVAYRGVNMRVLKIQPYSFYGNKNLLKINFDNEGSIGNNVCDGCINLQTAVLGQNVTEVGDYAFNGCSKLEILNIPDAVHTIGQNAFSGCSGIKTIIIGNGTESIGQYAFSECSEMESIILGNGIKTIGQYAFQNCSKLPTITIPGFVNNIGDYAFSGCKGLKNVIIEDCETDDVLNLGSNSINPIFGGCPLDSVYIGRKITYNKSGSYVYSPFYCNTSLRSIVVTNKGEEISENEFYGCTKLQKVLIGDGVTTIGNGAFTGCSSLKEVTVPNSVTSIGNYAFSGCSSLKSVEIGNGVKTIGLGAFNNCTSMTSVKIPGNVAAIGESAFFRCSSLKSVEIENGIEIIGYRTFSDCSNLTEVTIPNSVTTIGESAFTGCSSLKEVTVPNSVTAIGECAFSGCSNLTSVVIENGAKTIGAKAFIGCSSLKEVTIPNSVTAIGGDALECTVWYENQPDGLIYVGKVAYKYKGIMPENTSVEIKEETVTIGSNAFSGCTGLKSVNIPKSVTSIGQSAFSNCTGVTSIVSKANTPPTCGTNALDDINKWDCVLYVPEGYVSNYQATDQWKEFLFIEENKTSIRGDVNGDGVVNGTDIQAVINLIVDGEYDEKADVNTDGIVNGTDIQEVINIIVEGQ